MQLAQKLDCHWDYHWENHWGTCLAIHWAMRSEIHWGSQVPFLVNSHLTSPAQVPALLSVDYQLVVLVEY